MSPLQAIARGRSALLRTADRVNRDLHKRGCFEWSALRLAKAVAKVAVRRLSGRDRDWVLAETGAHLMWVPRGLVRQYVVKSYEPLATALLRNSLVAGSVMLDIGAHVGFFTLEAARAVGPSGHVHAFEPDPANLNVLRRNVEMNRYKNVSCHGQAVAGAVGQVPLVLAESNDCNSLYSHPRSKRRGTLLVDCVTVDSVLGGARVDVVKIDVEGAEIAVLQGMQRILEQNKSIRLFVELNPACLKAAGHSARELVRRLKGAAFRVYVIDEPDCGLWELDMTLAGIPEDVPWYYTNLFCLRGAS